MNNTEIAKAVVNNAAGFGIGAVTSQIVKTFMPRHQNPVIDAAIGASAWITGWAVSSTVKKPVRQHTDEQIDEIASALAEFKRIASQK